MALIMPPAIVSPAGLRAALFGDSITGFNLFCSPFLNGSANQYNPSATEIDFGTTGYFTAFQALNGHPFFHDPAQNHGVPGDTTNAMAVRYASDIAANFGNFDWLFILGGTNDYDASISKETTLANIQSFASRALAAGKTVVVIALFPRTGWGSDVGTQKTQGVKHLIWINQKLRNWVSTFSASVPLYLVDPWTDLSDPANAQGTGASWTINAAAFADGLHLSGYGAYLVAKRIAASLPPFRTFPWRGRGAIDNYDATDNPLGNLLANPCFMTTTGGTNSGNSVTASGGVPANWTAAQAMTGAGSFSPSEAMYSTIAAQSTGFDPTLGNVARFNANIASGKGSITKLSLTSAFVTSGITPGDQIRAVARARCTGLAGFCGAGLGFTYTPDGGATKFSCIDMSPNNNSGFNWGQDDHTLTLVSRIITVPNNIQTSPDTWVTLSAWFDATGATTAAGQLDWSDVQIRKVA
jgi:lysophospholipase L1-like esterase